MLVIKFIAGLLAALSIAKSYLDYRKKLEPLVMFMFWIFVWLVAAIILIYPSLIDRLIRYTKDQTITIGSLVGLAFIFMLYITYRIYAKAARIEYQQAEMIRKLGLSRSFKNKSK